MKRIFIHIMASLIYTEMTNGEIKYRGVDV